LRPAFFASFALLVLSVGCHPESDLQPESLRTPTDCGSRERLDLQVKKQAQLDFASIGKTCAEFDIQTFVQNRQETVWKACCSDKAFQYAYYPEKCVVRKINGPFECKN